MALNGSSLLVLFTAFSKNQKMKLEEYSCGRLSKLILFSKCLLFIFSKLILPGFFFLIRDSILSGFFFPVRDTQPSYQWGLFESPTMGLHVSKDTCIISVSSYNTFMTRYVRGIHPLKSDSSMGNEDSIDLTFVKQMLDQEK